MPTSKKVTDLKINKLTEAQYKAAVQAGVIDEDQLSLITDETEGQVKTFPIASADYEGQILQYVGVTDSTYTNGYFYKCTAQGTSPETYAWVQTDTQPSSGGGLPSQTGNAGKFLTTDGTDASWSDTVASPLKIKDDTWVRSIKFQNINGYVCTGFGLANANTDFMGVDWNRGAFVSSYSNGTIGTADGKWETVYTTKINNGADITVPDVAGKMAVQVSLLPTAASTNEGEIYQFVGTTDSSYTNGHFYKCVSDGQDPATYSWEEVQLGSGGGSSYTAGNGIDITGGVISTIAPTVIESGVSSGATGSHSIFGGTVTDEYSTVVGHSGSASGEYAVAVGAWATALGHYTTVVGAGASATYKSVAFGRLCVASGTYSTAIGFNCTASGDYSVQLGGNQSGVTNSDANTLKYSNENGNFEIVSADGTIPAARHAALPSADGTYVLKLVIANGVPTLSWVAE